MICPLLLIVEKQLTFETKLKRIWSIMIFLNKWIWSIMIFKNKWTLTFQLRDSISLLVQFSLSLAQLIPSLLVWLSNYDIKHPMNCVHFQQKLKLNYCYSRIASGSELLFNIVNWLIQIVHVCWYCQCLRPVYSTIGCDG